MTAQTTALILLLSVLGGVGCAASPATQADVRPAVGDAGLDSAATVEIAVAFLRQYHAVGMPSDTLPDALKDFEVTEFRRYGDGTLVELIPTGLVAGGGARILVTREGRASLIALLP